MSACSINKKQHSINEKKIKSVILKPALNSINDISNTINPFIFRQKSIIWIVLFKSYRLLYEKPSMRCQRIFITVNK